VRIGGVRNLKPEEVTDLLVKHLLGAKS